MAVCLLLAAVTRLANPDARTETSAAGVRHIAVSTGRSAELPRSMSDAGFRAMTWMYRLVDVFSGTEHKLARLPLRPGMTVVDYACGPGRYAIPVARFVGPVGRVYAVDIQPLAVKMVRDKAARAGLANVETVLVRGYDTGIPDACADLVLLLDAFHGIGDRVALVREVRRIIKPNGVFLMEPGHMDGAAARAIVAETNLFRHIETRGKDVHFAPCHRNE